MKKEYIDVKTYLLSCQVLGVTPHSSMGHIKKTYRSKVKELHPDKRIALDPSPQEFQRVQHAYEQILLFRKNQPDFSGENEEISQRTTWKKIEYAEKKQRRLKVKGELREEYRSGKTVGVPKKHYKVELFIMYMNQLIVFVQWFLVPPLCIYFFGVDGIWMAIGVNIVGFFFTVALLRNRHAYPWGRSLSLLARTLGFKK